jgi:hypothetical protein
LLQLIIAVAAMPMNDALEVRVSSPSTQKVTNAAAFTSKVGNTNNANQNDGAGAGKDQYLCYSGSAANFPPPSQWASFSNMWDNAKPALATSCANTESFGPGDSAAQIQDIFNSIQQVAEASLVDHRFILAVIMQEVTSFASALENGPKS